MAEAVAARDTWVFEGGMSVTYGTRMTRADMLVWLDLPVALRLWRVSKRLFRYLGRSRPDLLSGCVERLHPETLAFYRFIWTSRHTSRAKIAKLVRDPSNQTEVVHLKHPKDVAQFLSLV